MIRAHTCVPSGSRPSAAARRARLEDALVVAGQHLGEGAAAALSQSASSRAATADSVSLDVLALEQVVDDRSLVVGSQRAQLDRARG